MNKIKSIFISDVHLGSQHSSTKNLLKFLSLIKEGCPENIYIVGDFIDGWKLKRNWFWNDDCSLVIKKILGFVKRGTKIYYIAGNHDEFLRSFLQDFKDLNFGGIFICNEIIYKTVHEKNILVIHGDGFDSTIQFSMKYARWICFLGDVGYDFMIWFNKFVNFLRKKLEWRMEWRQVKGVEVMVLVMEVLRARR